MQKVVYNSFLCRFIRTTFRVSSSRQIIFEKESNSLCTFVTFYISGKGLERVVNFRVQ